jgi:hypothetical protein
VREFNDVGPARGLADLKQPIEAVVVVSLDLLGPTRQVVEWLAVWRQHSRNVR